MLAPIDFGRITTALAQPAGWVELAIVALCFAAGLMLDRRVRLRSASEAELVQLGLSGLNRVLLPLTALVLLLVAYAGFKAWHPPFFIAIALPLTVALAVIRILVFAVRRLFGSPLGLPASERAIAFGIWAIVLLYFTGILPVIRAELSEIEIPIGKKHLSVYEIVGGAIAVMFTVAVSLWVSGLVERRLMQATTLDSNVRAVLGKFVRALLLVCGVLFALQAVGIDLTVLAVFSGAVGVGIGLGLQKVASNYIAGFTILLDRSIRPGDMITVDNRFGVVSKLAARYVVVRSLDGVEAIVPNEVLATTTVLNHSYSSRNAQVKIPVQVGYGSDVDRALELLVAAALAEPRALRLPSPPEASVVRFADSGIDLELGFWIGDPENGQGGLKSAILRRVLQTFRDAGIEIPFPRREVRVLGDLAGAAGPDLPSTGRGPGTAAPESSPSINR